MDLVALNELLCSPFYERRNSLGRDSNGSVIVKPGQLIWAHVLYPTAKPQSLSLVELDRANGAKSTFKVEDFRPSFDPNFPVAELGLEDDERFYVVKGKRRQAIVLQTVRARFFQPNSPEQYAWVAPRFEFKIRHHLKFQVGVAAFDFPSLFYTPAHADGFDKPAALRFELAQSVPLSMIEPMFDGNLNQKFLCADSWAILQQQLYKYCSGGKILDEGIERNILAYSQLVREEYDKLENKS